MQTQLYSVCHAKFKVIGIYNFEMIKVNIRGFAKFRRNCVPHHGGIEKGASTTGNHLRGKQSNSSLFNDSSSNTWKKSAQDMLISAMLSNPTDTTNPRRLAVPGKSFIRLHQIIYSFLLALHLPNFVPSLVVRFSGGADDSLIARSPRLIFLGGGPSICG